MAELTVHYLFRMRLIANGAAAILTKIIGRTTYTTGVTKIPSLDLVEFPVEIISENMSSKGAVSLNRLKKVTHKTRMEPVSHTRQQLSNFVRLR